jgi:flavin-dependent dehydrogenase
MKNGDSYDAVVVGASLAGCTAARLLGFAGARVALVERRPDPEAYKVVCTHGIVSSATPTIQRLGLAPLIEARGALRIHGDGWTPYGGWIRAPEDAPYGYGISRRTLDPILRELAVETPGVDFLPGHSAARMLEDETGRPAGIAVEDRDHATRLLRAPLVVGADGRDSTVARLARVPGRVRPHDRFFYFAYWKGLRPQTDRARLWFLEPDGAGALPCEDDMTVVVAGAHRSRLPAFRADLEGSYRAFVSKLPDGPDLESGERVSKLIGKLEMPNVSRPAARPGLAFAGDAAIATDPVFGVGCAWAFQSGEWLADEVGPALLNGGDEALDAALGRYRRRMRRRLGLHHYFIADMATGRPARPFERALYRAAGSDPVVARAFDEVGSRRRSPLRFLRPRTIARVARSGAVA